MIRKIISLLLVSSAWATTNEWPVYKGNQYFTGNNDEITVQGTDIRWIFRAHDKVVNPIAAAGNIYFSDLQKNLYAVRQSDGHLLWRVNLPQVSAQFVAGRRTLGKPKYPLYHQGRLYIADTSLIYCFDAASGRVIWARTGLQNEKDPGPSKFGQTEGIFADPLISNDTIFYGTRKMFIAREARNGGLLWSNTGIQSFSAFPSFYDRYIITQSMDHGAGIFSVYCLDAATGKMIWRKTLEKPLQILAPVVYKGKVFVPVGKNLHALDLKTGEEVWSAEQENLITSNPSFTEEEIYFTVGNQNLVSVNAENGKKVKSLNTSEPSSPKFVLVRDEIYLAHEMKKSVGGKAQTFTRLIAQGTSDEKPAWEFIPPFEGGPSQPVVDEGSMYLPAGIHLYALGRRGPVKAGEEYITALKENKTITSDDKEDEEIKTITEKGDKKEDKEIKTVKTDEEIINDIISEDKPEKTKPKVETENPEKKIPTRKVPVTIQRPTDREIAVTVKKTFQDKVVYEKKFTLKGDKAEIEVPDDNDIEIITEAKDFIPEKKIIHKKDDKLIIDMKNMKKGEKIAMSSIRFASGKARLEKGSLDVLEKMAGALKERPGVKLKITGHTDDRGSEEYNRKLSEKRAAAVRDYLIKKGISPERLQSSGAGEAKPIADNKTAAGRAQNRRTEFEVISD